MNPSTAQATAAVSLLDPVEAANTAAATGDAVDVSAWDGPIIVTQQVGVVTAGSITGKIQTGDLANGSDAADLTGATFTAATEAGTQRIVIDANACKKYILYLGTVATGPAVVGVSALGTPKIA